MRRTCVIVTCATGDMTGIQIDVIDEHAFANRPRISNSIYILNAEATKKNHTVGNTSLPNEAESGETDRNNVYSTGRD